MFQKHTITIDTATSGTIYVNEVLLLLVILVEVAVKIILLLQEQQK